MGSNVNSYATLNDLKAVLGITSTSDDATLLDKLEAATRAIETYCQRRFYTTNEALYFDGFQSLWVPDLLSVTSVKTDENQDQVYEKVLTVTGTLSDIVLRPLNEFPKNRIDSSVVATITLAPGVKNGVEVTGVWGYGDGISATPYVTTPVTGSVTSTNGLTLVVSADGTIEPGHTLLVDSEQMYVTATAALAATVERGVNKSTPATHSTSTALSYYNYPRDVHQACLDLAVAMYQNRANKGMQSERLGDYSYTLSREMINSILDDSIRAYRRMSV